MERLAGSKRMLLETRSWQCEDRTRGNGALTQARMLCNQPCVSFSSRRVSRRGLKSFTLQVTCEKKATVLTPPLEQLTLSEPKVVHKYVKAFAPATVANLGPGFDFLGCAVDGLGDYVTAEVPMYV